MATISPRGWSSDPECEDETFADDDDTRAVPLLRAQTRQGKTVPQKRISSIGLGINRANTDTHQRTEADHTGQTEVLSLKVKELSFENERLLREIHDFKETEELLMRELRRLRVEYNAAVSHQVEYQQQKQQQQDQVRNENQMVSGGSPSCMESSYTGLQTNEKTIMSSVSASILPSMIDREATAASSAEIRRLRTLLNQAWKEAQDVRERAKTDIEDLRETMAREASALAATETQKKRLSDKLLDAHQEIARLNEIIQTQKMELNRTLTDAEKSSLQLVSHHQKERLAAEAREKALSVELEVLRTEHTTLRERVAQIENQHKVDQEKQEKQMYEQFIAYRELWKKNSIAFEALDALQHTLLCALADHLPVNSSNSGPSTSARSSENLTEGSSTPALSDTEGSHPPEAIEDAHLHGLNVDLIAETRERIMSGVTKIKSSLFAEHKRREVAERNFSICQKRLDRATQKIEALQEQIIQLQSSNALQESADVTFAEYEHWWNHFKTVPMSGGSNKAPQHHQHRQQTPPGPSQQIQPSFHSQVAEKVLQGEHFSNGSSAGRLTTRTRSRARDRDISQTAARQQANLLRNVSTDLLQATNSNTKHRESNSFNPARRHQEFPGIHGAAGLPSSPMRRRQ